MTGIAKRQEQATKKQHFCGEKPRTLKRSKFDIANASEKIFKLFTETDEHSSVFLYRLTVIGIYQNPQGVFSFMQYGGKTVGDLIVSF